VSPLRVVLVDDTPDIRFLLRAALEAGGRLQVVGEAGDGAQGLEVVARTRPDLVLVDLAMPVVDGLAALPALRRACPSARIVVFSGFAGSRLLPRARAAGADAYLQKGLDPWVLEQRLLEIAERGGPPPEAVDHREEAVDRAGQDDEAWSRTAVAAAVHEIRNPTVVIAGAVAALLGQGPDGVRPPDALRDELLAAVARQVRLLDQATADLLAAAESGRGALVVRPRPLVLSELLADAVTDAGVDRWGAGHVTLDCPPRLAVHADPVRIQQMVLNLLTNAAKYGAPPIILQARPDGDSVRVLVRDHGPGVPAEAVPTLFEEFSRAPGSGAPGSGLGLFVVRSLARAQGGRAWYEGGAEGTVFAFTLPAAPPSQGGAADEPVDAVDDTVTAR
jgi:signal transduction histidine kinase